MSPQQLAQPGPDCIITQMRDYVRAYVGSRTSTEIQACYRALAVVALERRVQRVLIVGASRTDAHSHLAARDAITAIHEVGVPAGFKIAFVPHTDVTRNGYRHAELEAQKLGLRAKVFADEAQAVRWLEEPDRH